MANKIVVALLLAACFVVAQAYEYVQPPPEFNGEQSFCYRECYNQCVFPSQFCKWWCGKGCIYPLGSVDKTSANNLPIVDSSLHQAAGASKVPIPTEEDYANAPAFVKAEAPSKKN